MKVLGIDTSTRTCSVALVESSTPIGEFTVHDKRTHSERLMPLIDSIFKNTGINPCDLSGIAVSKGPGSFTGLRIGIGTAQGLSMGYEIPLVGVSTLDALAFQRAKKGYVCPVMDAKRKEVYTSLYRVSEQKFERIWDYHVISPETLVNKLSENFKDNETITFTGDGVQVYEQKLKSQNFNMDFTFKELETNRAFMVARLGLKSLLKGEGFSPHKISPMYLRKSEAERKRENCHD
ncbi:tRNA (adenosine(37)-N6)-threonylcarbamoyltransferase complex dimerization subunit type 1 TsaB [Natranaerobius trueperi]|uniref:tRNA (Adenosine(37)-N6)-threonylcarbamoyltransferase complex dimerization subunit type 1 TsaB n=1 Tax=Natranaerobius trueperi TaxID=759412 RepID=A0A226C326_9FIRM|nr:tRNA (adenosine(37)-N6)-threonylcarbamoyltransferase complex dimerization subunit type 1 TsaB [Natranaerobius trueperi]OWZ84800.1 tRNA (adenosine(37)-N6)-threonylcarbamoyltransferase complex dimerization subunit type 1 TsaB [Natranaerobius trueperi]